jgi:hypothetical protein
VPWTRRIARLDTLFPEKPAAPAAPARILDQPSAAPSRP